MKKFGLNKKDKSDEADDSSRSRLFGKSKSKPSNTPTISNPYAIEQPSTIPNPYAQSSSSFATSGYGSTVDSPYGDTASMKSQAPPPYQGGYSDDRMRNDKSPVPAGGYGGTRYGNSGPYGASQGYGDDRYGTGESSAAGYRPGGYGGLGRSQSQETMDTQAGKDALFGGAKERYEQRQQQTQPLPPEENPALGYGTSGGPVMDMGYGTYQDRQLTAEEQEEEDVQATKQQIRQIKQQDVASTRNALRIAEQAERTGRETLERLGQQGERIHNTEKNLDLAANQNRLAEDKAKELKHLNRSMWAMHVGNPFTKSRRERDRDEEIITQHQADRMEREATRASAYESQARREQAQRDLRNPEGITIKKGNLAERSKYQFEADSEDEAMEDEIDANLDALHGAAGRLNQLGRAMGREVDSQNEHISRIAIKADKVDDGIAMNRGRLDRIK